MAGAGEPTQLQGWDQGVDLFQSVLISLLPPAPAAGIRQAGAHVPIGRLALYPLHFISEEETRAPPLPQVIPAVKGLYFLSSVQVWV